MKRVYLMYKSKLFISTLLYSGMDIIIRRSTTNEDKQDGFGKNRSIIEIRPVKGRLGGDGGGSDDFPVPVEIKKERKEVSDGRRREHIVRVSTVFTTSTSLESTLNSKANLE
jgi:hypothetical protein